MQRGLGMAQVDKELAQAPSAIGDQATAADPSTNRPQTRRYYSLDGLRAFAMLLGIFLHAALPYLRTDRPFWPVVDESRSAVLTIVVNGVHAFRMPVFFIMAGFFANMLLKKRGFVGFVRHRSLRIVVPFLICVFILVPIMQAVCTLAYGSMKDEVFDRVVITNPEAMAYRTTLSEFFLSGKCIQHFELFHFWFLWFLLIFYTVFLVARPIAGPIFATALPDRLMARIMRSTAKPVLLAVPTAVIFYLCPQGAAVTDVAASIPLLLYYGFFFAFGWALFRQKELLEQCKRGFWAYLGCATGLGLLLLLLPRGTNVPGASWGDRALLFSNVMFYSIFTWLMVFGLMGLFMRYFDKPIASARYISDSSYWLYLVHLPLIILLQMAFSEAPVAALMKFVAIAALATLVLLVSYEHLVRYTFIGALLNGPKQRPAHEGRVMPMIRLFRG